MPSKRKSKYPRVVLEIDAWRRLVETSKGVFQWECHGYDGMDAPHWTPSKDESITAAWEITRLRLALAELIDKHERLKRSRRLRRRK